MRNCLRVIDGSHRWGLQRAALAFRHDSVEDALLALPPELQAEARDAEIEVQLQPGDVSLHHCLTFHSSGPNGSGWPRKTLVTRYFDGDCSLQPERLPSPEARAYFKTDERGRLCGPDFPLLYEEERA